MPTFKFCHLKNTTLHMGFNLDWRNLVSGLLFVDHYTVVNQLVVVLGTTFVNA